MSHLFTLENRIDPGSLDVLLQLRPARVATEEGSQNIHGLTRGMNGASPTNRTLTHADTEWCSMSLDKGCGIEGLEPVEHQHHPPRELNYPVTYKVSEEGTGVEVGWDSA